MNPFKVRELLTIVVCVGMGAAPAFAQGVTLTKQGQGGSVVKGAAGTEGGRRRQWARTLRQADGRDGRRRATGLRCSSRSAVTTCDRRSA